MIACLGTFTADTTGQLDILGHDSDTLGVDSTKVGILEKSNKVSFRSFLKSQDGSGLEAKVRLEVLGNLTDETLERSLRGEENSVCVSELKKNAKENDSEHIADKDDIPCGSKDRYSSGTFGSHGAQLFLDGNGGAS